MSAGSTGWTGAAADPLGTTPDTSPASIDPVLFAPPVTLIAASPVYVTVNVYGLAVPAFAAVTLTRAATAPTGLLPFRSTAPMSIAAPATRARPRWSVARLSGLLPASTSGLPASG